MLLFLCNARLFEKISIISKTRNDISVSIYMSLSLKYTYNHMIQMMFYSYLFINKRIQTRSGFFFGRSQELSVQPYEKSRASRTNSYNWAGNKLDYRYLVRLGCIYSECQVLNEGRFTIKTINYSNSSAVLKFLKILAQQRY